MTPDAGRVHVAHDPDAETERADSNVPGLVSEVPTSDALIDHVTAVAGDLLAANGTTTGPVSLGFVIAR